MLVQRAALKKQSRLSSPTVKRQLTFQKCHERQQIIWVPFKDAAGLWSNIPVDAVLKSNGAGILFWVDEAGDACPASVANLSPPSRPAPILAPPRPRGAAIRRYAVGGAGAAPAGGVTTHSREASGHRPEDITIPVRGARWKAWRHRICAARTRQGRQRTENGLPASGSSAARDKGDRASVSAELASRSAGQRNALPHKRGPET